MAELNNELLDSLTGFPLPLELIFPSKELKLADVLGAEEKKIRNKAYDLSVVEGKKGMLTLAGVDVARIEVAAGRVNFNGDQLKERLPLALEYGDVPITAVIGRALLPKEAVAQLKPGGCGGHRCPGEYLCGLGD
jgi:hypothetical protein